WRGIQHVDQIERRLGSHPARAPPRLVHGDALAHLVVIGVGRGDIGPGCCMAGRQHFPMAALARARTANNEGQSRLSQGNHRSSSIHPSIETPTTIEKLPRAATSGTAAIKLLE